MLLPHTSEWDSHPHGDRVSWELPPFPSVPLPSVGKFRMNESHVLAPMRGCLRIVLATARVIHHVVDDLAVALGAYTGFAILQQLHVMVEDDGRSPIDTAVARW